MSLFQTLSCPVFDETLKCMSSHMPALEPDSFPMTKDALRLCGHEVTGGQEALQTDQRQDVWWWEAGNAERRGVIEQKE
ncbi:hypothetical protein NQZ68_029215 [Dissostichus eleginoides]|nr:hypothetical protein NQZ68_029215 [Dissostichus eleginoides]